MIPSPHCDRIDPINCRNQGYSSKFKNCDSWSSSVDFFLFDRWNLDHKHSSDAEMSVEEIRIKIFKRFGIYRIQFTRIALEYFTILKNISIYSQFGRNRPMKRIYGSDEMHQYESLSLSRGRWIAIGRIRWSHVARIINRISNACHWTEIGCIKDVFRRFSLNRYNSSRSTVEIQTHPVSPILPCTPFT